MSIVVACSKNQQNQDDSKREEEKKLRFKLLNKSLAVHLTIKQLHSTSKPSVKLGFEVSPLSNPYNQSCATNNGVKPQLTEEPEVGAESQLPAAEPLRLLKGFAGERWLTGSGVWHVPLQSNGKRASSVSPVRCQSSGREAGVGCNSTGPAGDATTHENRLAGLIQTQVKRGVTDWQPEHLDLLQRP